MSNETSFTPGPWEVGGGKAGGSPGRVYCDDSTGSCIALVHGEKGQEFMHLPMAQREANARLIAAAPDLFYALQAIDRDGITQATWDRATRAMAKATQA